MPCDLWLGYLLLGHCNRCQLIACLYRPHWPIFAVGYLMTRWKTTTKKPVQPFGSGSLTYPKSTSWSRVLLSCLATGQLWSFWVADCPRINKISKLNRRHFNGMHSCDSVLCIVVGYFRRWLRENRVLPMVLGIRSKYWMWNHLLCRIDGQTAPTNKHAKTTQTTLKHSNMDSSNPL